MEQDLAKNKEQEQKTTATKPASQAVSAPKNAKPKKPTKAVPKTKKHAVKNTTTTQREKSKTPKETAEENYKMYGLRYIKDAFKIYAENHPDDVYKFITGVMKNAGTDSKYAELAIKCLGGFDAQETKLSGAIETSQKADNPLFRLTVEELRTLKDLKGGKK